MKHVFSSILFLMFLSLIVFSCKENPFSAVAKGKKVHDKHCGSCHSLSSPTDLPKDIWEKYVLPEMGARMGIKTEGYNPSQNADLEDIYLAGLANIYPASPVLPQKDWELLKAYVLKYAPDSLEKIADRSFSNKRLELFTDEPFAIDEIPGGYITSLIYDSEETELLIGNAMGVIYGMDQEMNFTEKSKLGSPVIHNASFEAGRFSTEIGILDPSESSAGRIWFYSTQDTIAQLKLDNLHRPVFNYTEDFNGDGEMDFLVCEFGHYTGQLNLYTSNGANYDKQTLLNQPGVIKVEYKDLNKDGVKEIIAIVSQGNEGVYLYEDDGELNFTEYNPIQVNPVHGSSWMEIADLNNDGFDDIVLVNGDNADYSVVPKPYHGLRIYINDGSNEFTQDYFYPINGATRVVGEDFDQDGDVDFAVTAFFPDYENNRTESFIYLENITEEEFTFSPHTFENSINGRWLLMESGDFDQDGDIDIMLGSCIQETVITPEEITNTWQSNNVDLVLLKNKLR